MTLHTLASTDREINRLCSKIALISERLDRTIKRVGLPEEMQKVVRPHRHLCPICLDLYDGCLCSHEETEEIVCGDCETVVETESEQGEEAKREGYYEDKGL